MLKKKKAALVSIAMLLTASVIWGSSFVVVKDSLDYVTPAWQLFDRLAIASLGGTVIFAMQRKYVCAKYIRQGVVLGIIFAAALIFQNYGADLSSASKCAFLTVSYVAFIPVIEAVFLRKTLTARKAATVAVCLAGVALITLNERFSLEWCDIFLLLTGFFYAMHLLWIDHCGEKDGVIIIHVVQIWTACLISLASALILEPFSISKDGSFLLSIIYCGIFEVLIGFLLQFRGQQNTSPQLSGILLSSECVFAGIFGAIFQNDSFSVKMGIGCLLILISAVMESLNFERKVENGNQKDVY